MALNTRPSYQEFQVCKQLLIDLSSGTRMSPLDSSLIKMKASTSLINFRHSLFFHYRVICTDEETTHVQNPQTQPQEILQIILSEWINTLNRGFVPTMKFLPHPHGNREKIRFEINSVKRPDQVSTFALVER